MNSPNSNCSPRAIAGRVRTATTPRPMRPSSRTALSALDCSPSENFSIPDSLTSSFTCSFVRYVHSFNRSFVRSLACRYGYLSLVGGVSARTARINYPRPKPHVVARGHSRESARRYTRVSRPYARVSVPSNLRVAAVHRIYARGIRESQYNHPQRIDERKKDVICRRRSRTRSRSVCGIHRDDIEEQLEATDTNNVNAPNRSTFESRLVYRISRYRCSAFLSSLFPFLSLNSLERIASALCLLAVNTEN